MKHYAVLGDPIAHSRSPELYNALFEKYGMDAEFGMLRMGVGGISELKTKTKGLSGFAVTMPLKRAIIPYLDALDESASACGAVNITELREGRLIGYNTDGEGLCDALFTAGVSVCGAEAAILGRGGAALSAACSLKKRGANVRLLARTPKADAASPERLVSDPGGHADLFINASPLGMDGHDEFAYTGLLDSLAPSVVFDMVYVNGRETALALEAKRRGVLLLTGESMLKKQALRAFKIWTGVEAEF